MRVYRSAQMLVGLHNPQDRLHHNELEDILDLDNRWSGESNVHLRGPQRQRGAAPTVFGGIDLTKLSWARCWRMRGLCAPGCCDTSPHAACLRQPQ